MKHYILSFFLATVYFIAGFITLSSYGISWDETIHFYRGQAYAQYFLTGKKTYDDLPQIDLQGKRGDPSKITPSRRSFYQSDLYNGEYFLKNDSGHPLINGELAAFSNIIFYQKLGILGDLQSHHLFNILASSLLVFVVVYFASETLGLFAGIVAGLSLILYPLFWAESHFNIKDPPEAAFFAATIWSFYKSTKSFSKSWLLLSFLFFALAAGTKFNAFFIPPVIILYFLLKDKFNFLLMWKKLTQIPRGYLMLLVFGPLLSFFIFVGLWPYLWQNFPGNLFKIFKYYKEIGTNARYQQDNFFIQGFNLFPVLWIVYTSPPVLLVFSLIGFIALFLRKNLQKGIALLWALWLVLPIARVSLPNTVIYGGIRQILEFLPAMSLMSAFGAYALVEYFKRFIKGRFIVTIYILIVLMFLWPLLVIIKMHPNENVYFNFLIGGLKGAQEKNFPSWGNSFGNAYLQGIKWINENAEKGAKLALIQGTSPNAPAIFLRPDIDYKSGNWSGINRDGEYLMELTFNDSARNFNYAWDYVENFLTPVYELKVEGVPILKIWKNDLQHSKESARKVEIEFSNFLDIRKAVQEIQVDLGKEKSLSRVYLFFDPLPGCLMPEGAFVEISKDGSDWIREKDPIPFPQIKQEENLTANQIEYFIAGKKARYVKFVFENKSACPLNYRSFKVLVLK